MSNQDILDYQCDDILKSIKAGETFKLTCLNYLKNHASSNEVKTFWLTIGNMLLEHDWLTLDVDQNFKLKTMT